MKLKYGLLLLLVSTLTGVMPLTAASRTYYEKTGDKTDVHHFIITETVSGFTVDLKTTKHEGYVITQQFKLYKDLATWKWLYDCPKMNTKITASLKDGEIYMFAVDEGEKVEKVFDTDDLPWNQSFNIGLEGFAMSKASSMKFKAIGVGGPGNMKITSFKVKRKEPESLSLSQMNETVDAEHMTISLSGLLSIFWTGHYWFRKSDGRFLCYKGKNKRGAPVSVMELVSCVD